MEKNEIGSLHWEEIPFIAGSSKGHKIRKFTNLAIKIHKELLKYVMFDDLLKLLSVPLSCYTSI